WTRPRMAARPARSMCWSRNWVGRRGRRRWSRGTAWTRWVLRLAATMGGRVERLLVVGCEPAPLGEDDDMRISLSDPVRAAVDEAVAVIESLIGRLLHGECAGARRSNIFPQKEVRPCRDLNRGIRPRQ